MIIIFFISFAVYLYTLFPTIAAYRDAGEMATVTATLGIAHPPGYPLYILMGKIFTALIPFGNTAYRMNVFSALFSSLTVLMICLVSGIIYSEFNREQVTAGNRINGKVYWLLPGLVLGFSYLQWYLSLVSEMYTLNTFFASLILYFVIKELARPDGTNFDLKPVFLIALLFGLGVGNRMDLVLLAPGFVFLLWKRRKTIISKNAVYCVLLLVFIFCLGLSVYLYLPARSVHEPLIDWNHPSTLGKLIATLTRKSHGGTLDLLSLNYAKGENFIPDMVFFLRHMLGGFAYAGVLFILAGFYALYIKKRDVLVFILVCLAFSWAWFIYEANMPPNTHALAILEAHFLMPNLLFFILLVSGLFYFIRNSGILITVSVLLIIINIASGFTALDKRNNFFAYDYACNVLRSLKPESVTVIREDVQIFSIWYVKDILNKFREPAVVAQGLANSPWYHNMMQKTNPDVYLCRLDDNESWREFVQLNSAKTVYFTGDAEVPSFSGLEAVPRGLVSSLSISKNTLLDNTGVILMDDIYIYRGDYDYKGYREFFSPDLISDYANARYRLGEYYMNRNIMPGAQGEFYKSLMFDSDLALAAFHLGYTYFVRNNFAEAEKVYERAVSYFKITLELARRYRSLPDVVSKIRNDLADTYLHLGVTEERMNKQEEALGNLSHSIEYNPNLSRAYFNRAVIFWKRNDWNSVIGELNIAVGIDPSNTEIRYYLDKARQNLRK